jgi:hypothetical protein
LRIGHWARFKQVVLENPEAEFSDPLLNRLKELVLHSPDITLAEAAAEVERTPESLVDHVKAELARIEERQRAREELGEEEEEGERPPPAPRRPYQRLRVQIARTLDQEYAHLISQLTEKTGWFNQVLTDLGFYSTLLAFQAARVPPAKIPEQVEKFRNPEEFTRFVKDQLSALMRAVQESERILDLEDQVRDLEAENELLAATLEQAIEQASSLATLLKVAMALMPPQSLRQFLLVAAASSAAPQQGEEEWSSSQSS